MSNILCIDDEPSVSVTLENLLKSMGHRPVLASSFEECVRVLGQEPFDLIISDETFPGGTGSDVLEHLRQNAIDVPVIVTSPYSKVDQAVQIMRQGAVDYLTKPLRSEALRLAVQNAIEIDRMRRLNENFRREISSLRGQRVILGDSGALRRVLEMIETVGPTRATVLLQGESGTGKELFARALHDRSSRRNQPFVSVNCAALPEGLVESAMFGHERGAFTGATGRSRGAFERAHGGTLLLDEISEMKLELQAKLLRAIQEQEIERVGGTQPIRVDVRIVATTNRDLWHEVEAGRFRRDLYYRLSVVPIHTPPLRERKEDIAQLVAHFAQQTAQEIGARTPEVPAETMQVLTAYDWPGNIRELANAIERAVILCRDGVITPDAFSFRAVTFPGSAAAATAAGGAMIPEGGEGFRSAPASAVVSYAASMPKNGGGWREAVASALPAGVDAPDQQFNLRVLERVTIQRALEATRGHRSRAARLLGISERTLRNKLKT